MENALYPEIDADCGNVVSGEKRAVTEPDKHASLANAAVSQQHHLENIDLIVSMLAFKFK